MSKHMPGEANDKKRRDETTEWLRELTAWSQELTAWSQKVTVWSQELTAWSQELTSILKRSTMNEDQNDNVPSGTVEKGGDDADFRCERAEP
jgi:hypothetical protein